MGQPVNLTYSILLVIAALVSATVMVLTWQRRPGPGTVPLTLLMLALTWWGLTYALHWSGFYRPTMFFWLDATYLGVVIVPAAFLAFVLQFTNRDHWLNRRNTALMALEPVLTLILLWTDGVHGLFFAGKRLADSGAILEGGAWFWINILYSYGLVFLAVLLLLRAYLNAPRLYRGQVGMVLMGALLPVFANALGLASLNPFPNMDLTPFAFTLTGVFFALALFQYRFLEIVPVARHALIENMNDGILVLDAKNRVVDINPAAQRLISGPASSPLGQEMQVFFSDWPEVVEQFGHEDRDGNEILIEGIQPRYLDLRVTPLYDRNGNFTGRLIILQDITARKRAEEELRLANDRLQAQLSEIKVLEAELREQAIRDPLTDLFNRRYLEETLERELQKAAREGRPVGLIIMDIDGFKAFNDTHGHKAGDMVLEALGELLRRRTRGGDVACRFGGEEFVLVFPGAALEDALARAEDLRSDFEKINIPYNGMQLHTTLSVGVAAFPVHGKTGEEIVSGADQALYAAKEAGRNCVRVWAGIRGPGN